MKRFLLMCCLISGIATTYAQKSNVESAAIYFRNLEMEDAKKAIDEAALNDETKNDPKMWFYYAQIYDTLYKNPAYQGLDKDLVEKYVIGCKKCLETDTKKRYEYYCGFAIVNSAFAAYNKAIEYYGKNDVANTAKFFQYVIDVFPYDKNKDLIKNNINEKTIVYSMAGLALNNKDYPEAKKNLNKLIDMNYNDHMIYILLSNIHMMESDTAKALKVIEEGKAKFAGEKDLINQELYIYQEQGRTDFLLNKYNEAIESEPENTLYLYNRGAMMADLYNKSLEKARMAFDTAGKIRTKAKTEKVPATKAKLDKAAKYYSNLSDSMITLSKDYAKRSEADYLKAISVNPDYLDANYNLAALCNNIAAETGIKMNALDFNAPDYKKKFDKFKKYQDSVLNVALKYFNKSLEIAEAMPESEENQLKEKRMNLVAIYTGLQSLYGNLGDLKKSTEMRNNKLSISLIGEPKATVVRSLEQPKNISKNTNEEGVLVETWEYDGLKVIMWNGKVKEAILVK